MPLRPLSAQIVGSYAKPHWLARHERMRAHDDSFWRPEPEVLREARQDAARLAIYEQERAGLDIVTDGEATLIATWPPTGAMVAWATRAALALSGVAGSFGEIPAFGPSNESGLPRPTACSTSVVRWLSM